MYTLMGFKAPGEQSRGNGGGYTPDNRDHHLRMELGIDETSYSLITIASYISVFSSHHSYLCNPTALLL